MRILIVEDNITYAGLVAKRLAESGFDSDQASSVSEAKHAISKMDYAAILLDLGLPDQNGDVLLQDLRSRGDSTPVLIVTARNGLKDRIKGLRDGADDYLAKPFSMDELVARLHVLLRRRSSLFGQNLSAGNVSLDVSSHRLSIDGRAHPVGPRELAVLALLMRHKGSTVAQRLFIDQLSGISGEQDANAIDVFIHHLATQLADAGATVKIHAIRGVGYMMSEGKVEREGS